MENKCILLTSGVYKDIPDVLTLKKIPTVSELDYATGDEFDKVLIDSILPQSIEERINFNDLLEIDFQHICRELRIFNFGPYHTATSVWCEECGEASHGEYLVDLRNIACSNLPPGFTNDFVIKKDEFVDFNGDIRFKLPTIQQILNAYKDKAFQSADGKVNREFARICYMVYSVKGKDGLSPIEIKLQIQNNLSAADFVILKGVITDMADFGLRAGGSCKCPKCSYNDAVFLGMSEDRFFKPTLGDLRMWKQDKVKASTPSK